MQTRLKRPGKDGIPGQTPGLGCTPGHMREAGRQHVQDVHALAVDAANRQLTGFLIGMATNKSEAG